MAFVVRGRIDTNAVHPRYEIRKLYDLKEPKICKQWTLFVLGFLGVQHPDEPMIPFKGSPALTAEPLLPPGGDFFSIGAVHGLPYERWPGDPASDQIVPDKKPEAKLDAANIQPVNILADQHDHAKEAGTDPITPGDDKIRYGGYCNHGSILFPPWHRPYVMAIEESIGRVATAIAKEFALLAPGEANEWEEAAACLRFPFWDWTRLPEEGEDSIPSLLIEEKVTIIGPNGETMSVQNPIKSFNLEKYLKTERCRQFADVKVQIPWTAPKPEDWLWQMGYYRSWHRTVRWPVDSAQAQDQPGEIKSHMKDRLAELRNKVAHMFSLEDPNKYPKKFWPHQWDRFSNTTVKSTTGLWATADPASELPPVGPPPVSLEAPHNWMHLILGGMGHMGQNEFAGLDPVFYLHHANCDRLYALWEYCYPEYRPKYGWYNVLSEETEHFMQPGGTFTQLPASRLDQWSDMLPWRNALGSYWTLDNVSWENRDKWPNFYTYPPTAGVNIDVPAPDEATRMHARAKLQSYFQLGAKESVKQVEKVDSPIFTTAPRPRDGGPFNPDLEQLGQYRHFVVACELSEHLYNESYVMELSYTSGPQKEVWRGHAAVLTRPIDSPCEGCQRRRAANVKVKDMIHLPAPRIAAILEALPETRSKTEADEANTLKQLIKGRLIGRGGAVYAYTISSDTTAAESDLLPPDLAPKLRFMTAHAGLTKKEKEADAPVEFYNWQDFGEVFEGLRWKMGQPPKDGPDADY